VSESSTDEPLVETAVEAIGAGRPVVLPTDTVYGLCSSPLAPESLSRLKGRGPDQPIALLASDVDILLELVPELPEQAVRALLPGRLTLILPNPEGRFPLLAGSGPPWTFALVIATAPKPSSAVFASAGRSGIRTPIVSGRDPARSGKRRSGFGRISVSRPGRRVRTAGSGSSGTSSSRMSTSDARSAIG